MKQLFNPKLCVIEDEVRNALQNRAFIPALALALTIPDAYGQIEYPYEKVGYRYQNWCHRFCNFPVPPHTKKHDSGILYFDGVTCYKLRCELLHSGDAEIETEDLGGMPRDPKETDNVHTASNTSFIIRIGVSSSYGKNWVEGHESDSNYTVVIGLEQLCNTLCDAADGYKRSLDKRKQQAEKVGITIDNCTDSSMWTSKG